MKTCQFIVDFNIACGVTLKKASKSIYCPKHQRGFDSLKASGKEKLDEAKAYLKLLRGLKLE